MPTSRGFILIATTHPYYGRMAANLANSIKAAAPDSQIAIVTDTDALSHLNAEEKALFDFVIDDAKVGTGVGGSMRIRLELPHITPFDETISMDVDTIWLPKANPNDVFDLLKDRDFTIVNEGYTDLATGESKSKRAYTHWGDPKEIAEVYELTGKLWKVRGEFIVFRNGDEAVELFARARSVIEEPQIDVMKLGGAVTDEFALNIAMAQMNIEPHKADWEPAYWPLMHGGILPAPYKLPGYSALSFGGNAITRTAAKMYEQIGKAAAYKTGVRWRFPLYAKKEFSPERRKN